MPYKANAYLIMACWFPRNLMNELEMCHSLKLRDENNYFSTSMIRGPVDVVACDCGHLETQSF